MEPLNLYHSTFNSANTDPELNFENNPVSLTECEVVYQRIIDSAMGDAADINIQL